MGFIDGLFEVFRDLEVVGIYLGMLRGKNSFLGSCGIGLFNFFVFVG